MKDRYGHKIDRLESYLVYSGKKYCLNCVLEMMRLYHSLPNDGSAKGALIAMKLDKSRKELKNESFDK